MYIHQSVKKYEIYNFICIYLISYCSITDCRKGHTISLFFLTCYLMYFLSSKLNAIILYKLQTISNQSLIFHLSKINLDSI